MLKYLMMAGVIATALTAGSSGAYAKNGSTFFANQPSTCHRELSNLGVVKAIWVGCNFKWWGGAFEPGNNPGGNGVYVSESTKDRCRPPPPKCYPAKIERRGPPGRGLPPGGLFGGLPGGRFGGNSG